jgi:hypothetical protein
LLKFVEFSSIHHQLDTFAYNIVISSIGLDRTDLGKTWDNVTSFLKSMAAAGCRPNAATYVQLLGFVALIAKENRTFAAQKAMEVVAEAKQSGVKLSLGAYTKVMTNKLGELL